MARWRDVKKGKIENKHPDIVPSVDEDFSQNASVMTQIKAVITDLFMLVMPLMYLSIYVLLGGREGFAANMTLGWAYILIPYLIISTIFLITKGQTPGMKAYEIKIVKTKSKLDINILQALIRQGISILTTMSIIGLLFPFFRKDHKTIQDMIISATIIQFPNE